MRGQLDAGFVMARLPAPSAFGPSRESARTPDVIPSDAQTILEMSQVTTGRAIGQRNHVSAKSTAVWRRSGALLSVVAGGRQEPPQAGQRSPSPNPALGDSSSPTSRRALIIVENASVPEDRRVWHEALSLREAGWDVTVLAPDTGMGGARPTDEVIDGLRVRRFVLRAAEATRLGHLGEYSAAMWRIWREVRDLAREQAFDVIQVCNPPDFLLLAALGQRRRGTRLIFDHHDLTPELYTRRAGRPNRFVHLALLILERLAFRLADVTLATNGSLKRIAIERGGRAPEDVFVVRNGPMLERFRPTAKDPSLAAGRGHLLVYVGVMGPQDGVDHAVHALSHLGRPRQDWHAVFLGDGETLPELRRLASQLELEDRIEFPGFVSDEQVRRTICSADVCLAPDPRNRYTDRTTLVKIAEYMALSAPIVSYDLAESRVTAGDAAVFATNNDPAEFARLIDELLDDPERRRELGATGRARVERELAWEHSERALLAAYGRAIAK